MGPGIEMGLPCLDCLLWLPCLPWGLLLYLFPCLPLLVPLALLNLHGSQLDPVEP